METDMELSKKTTILLTPDLHARLTRLAHQKGVSVGELIRTACERQYGLVSEESRSDAVRQLATLGLPVSDPQTMKRESVPGADELLP
jgi:3-dehydroquinate synthetase